MADYFVRSLATGAGTGLNWTDAYTTLAAAFNARAAGDRFWVADDHNEVSATAITLTSKGTIALPSTVYCVDHNVASPGLSDLRSDPYNTTTPNCARITTTGNVAITLAGVAYCYGVMFSAGTGGNNLCIIQFNQGWILENCSLRKGGTFSSTTALYFGTDTTTLINTTIMLGNAVDKVNAPGGLIWRNTNPGFINLMPTGGPFRFSASANHCTSLISGVDLSNVTTSLIDIMQGQGTILFENCRLHSSITVPSAQAVTNRNCNVYFTDCDSGNTNFRQIQQHYSGTLTTNTFVGRTGGNSNDLGTLVSWQIATTANARWLIPFVTMPLVINNARINQDVTVTVYGVFNGVSLPWYDDVWIDALYHGNADSPLSTFKTTNKTNNLSNGAPLPADTSAWDTQATLRTNSTVLGPVGQPYRVASAPGKIFFVFTQGTSAASEPTSYSTVADGGSVTDGGAVLRAGVRFAMSVVLTAPQPQTEAAIKITVGVSRANSTFYIDPRPVLS